jgi:hypothetical protein
LLQLEPEDDDGGAIARLARAHAWVDARCAIASIDLPLSGTRRSAKLTDLLDDAVGHATRGDPIGDAAHLLWLEFTRQATLELRRTLDLMTTLPTIDAERIGYAGFGLGGLVGAVLCAVDTRPAAVVLGGAGAGIAPAAIAPESFIGRIAPRPLLFVHDGNPPEGQVSRLAAEKLHAAAGDPKQIEWRTQPNAALDTAWEFLSKRLCR